MLRCVKSGYVRGIFWSVLVCLISNMNDVLIKVLGQNLYDGQVVFCRFFFSAVTLLPLLATHGFKAFRTQQIKIHLVRGTLLFLALTPWCYGVIKLPLTLSTTIGFSTPIFVVILARIFLKECLDFPRIVAIIAGSLGVFISINPGLEGLNSTAFLLITSTIFFATLDVINKNLLTKDEGLIPMLFHSAWVTAFLSLPLAFANWKMPSVFEFTLMIALGIGANLILFFLLKAFAACDISALQPFRYVEFIFSSFFSLFLFHQLPDIATLLGAAFIIPATFYISYIEINRSRRVNHDNA